jgi:hypothetical protein
MRLERRKEAYIYNTALSTHKWGMWQLEW